VSPLYPPAAGLLLLGPSYRVFELYVLLHLFLGGLVMSVFLRALGCPWKARAVGGVCYMLCGFNLAQLGHTSSFAVPAAWLPLVLLTFYRMAQVASMRRVAGAAVALALLLLDGHLQIAVYGILAAWVWFWWLRLRDPGSRRLSPSVLFAPLIATVLALALASPRLLPAAAHLRSTAPPAAEESGPDRPLQAHEALTLPWPGTAQHMAAAGSDRPLAERYAYIGMAGLLLAVAGVASRSGWFFAIAALAALAASLGAGAPLHRLFGSVGLPVLRSQTRPLLLADICLCVLAGLGAARLLRPSHSRLTLRRGTAISAALLLAAGTLAIPAGNIPRDMIPSYLTTMIPGTLFLAAAVVVMGWGGRLRVTMLLVLAVTDIAYFSSRLPQPFQWSPADTYHNYRFRELHRRERDVPPPRVDTSALQVAHNAPLVAGISTTGGWVGWRRVPWRYELIRDELSAPRGLAEGLLPLVAAPYALVGSGRLVPPHLAALPVAEAKQGLRLVRFRKALPRAYLAHSAQVVPTWREALSALTERPSGRARQVLLETSALPPGAVQWRTAGDDSVSFLSYEDNGVRLRVVSGGWGVLVLSDTYYPGWSATVDGEPAPIWPAQLAFRGVLLEEGSHEVEFRYRDGLLEIGLVVMGLAVLGLALVAGRPSRRH
jgi:hypothetical protein